MATWRTGSGYSSSDGEEISTLIAKHLELPLNPSVSNSPRMIRVSAPSMCTTSSGLLEVAPPPLDLDTPLGWYPMRKDKGPNSLLLREMEKD